jgi:hypothetical protein
VVAREMRKSLAIFGIWLGWELGPESRGNHKFFRDFDFYSDWANNGAQGLIRLERYLRLCTEGQASEV